MRVAVIGAGIVGVTTAYELLCDGHQVTLFERSGSVAVEASFANAGVLAPGYVTPWAAPGMLRKVHATALALRCEIDGSARYQPEVETAVYAIVVEAVTGVDATVSVALVETDGDLVVTVDDASWSGGVVAVEDRVGAVGGSVARTGRRLEARLPAG